MRKLKKKELDAIIRREMDEKGFTYVVNKYGKKRTREALLNA